MHFYKGKIVQYWHLKCTAFCMSTFGTVFGRICPGFSKISTVHSCRLCTTEHLELQMVRKAHDNENTTHSICRMTRCVTTSCSNFP